MEKRFLLKQIFFKRTLSLVHEMIWWFAAFEGIRANRIEAEWLQFWEKTIFDFDVFFLFPLWK